MPNNKSVNAKVEILKLLVEDMNSSGIPAIFNEETGEIEVVDNAEET